MLGPRGAQLWKNHPVTMHKNSSGGNPRESQYIIGADNGIRTRDTKLGKLVLYQLSYVRS